MKYKCAQLHPVKLIIEIHIAHSTQLAMWYVVWLSQAHGPCTSLMQEED